MSSPVTTNGRTAPPPSNEDLLKEIFGSSPTLPQSPQAGKQKASVNDILGLFDSPEPSLPKESPSTLVPQSSTPVTHHSNAALPVSTTPRLTSFTVYDKNELKITLTPQVNKSKPGVVNILARFQVTGSNTASGINFQAAVPKVCFFFNCTSYVYKMANFLLRLNNYKCYLSQMRISVQIPPRANSYG